jgi:hypothetical protein
MRAINNPNPEFINTWAEELAEKFLSAREDLRRTPDEFRTKGLSALHFPRQTLEIHFQDSSFACFNFAFFVVSKDGQYIAVFTEHRGYFSWKCAAIKSITKIKEELVFPRKLM